MDIMKKIKDDTDKHGAFWLAAQLNVTTQTVYWWLAGNFPSRRNLENLANHYGCPVHLIVEPQQACLDRLYAFRKKISEKAKIKYMAGHCGSQGVADSDAPTESDPQG